MTAAPETAGGPYPTKRPPRRRNREAPGLHGSEAAVVLASWEPLHAVAEKLHYWQPGDPGPHPDVPPAVLVLFGIMSWNEGGQRGAERLFSSAIVWEPIRAIMYALRPGAESTNRWFKERLRDTRAPAIGVPRQHLHLVFGAMFNNFRAWLAHRARVGSTPSCTSPPSPRSGVPAAPPPSAEAA